jgi:predicted metal-dependent HD superfamily phosphohydrolase
MTPLERADRAKQLLEDAVLQAAFHDIRMQLVAKLEQVPFGDIDTQHEIALTLQLLKRLREQLALYANEVAVDKAKKKHESFVTRMRERLA